MPEPQHFQQQGMYIPLKLNMKERLFLFLD